MSRSSSKWRYVMVADEGGEVGFHGEYRELVPNERIVWTEIYEGLPEGLSSLTILVQAANKISRDAIIDSGMEGGMQDTFDLLEEVAVSLR